MWLPALTTSNYEYVNTEKEQQKEQLQSQHHPPFLLHFPLGILQFLVLHVP